MIYNKIYELCRVKNMGPFYENPDDRPSARAEWLIELARSLNIPYEVDRWETPTGVGHNVYLRGESAYWFVAHHDIVNPESENAQDNSCSLINLFALKGLAPWVNIALLDGEEVGGLGAYRLADRIEEDGWPAEWLLNLELTGRGGTEFLIGCNTKESRLRDLIFKTHPQAEERRVPFNDSWCFVRRGLDSVVINPLPRVDGELDMSELNVCHQLWDTADRVSIVDMQQFVESILLPIAKV